jgi:hypothetical protein
MNRDDIIRLALDAHLLNYVDHETPRRYFIRADADVEEVERFAALVAAAEREAVRKPVRRRLCEGVPVMWWQQNHCATMMWVDVYRQGDSGEG